MPRRGDRLDQVEKPAGQVPDPCRGGYNVTGIMLNLKQMELKTQGEGYNLLQLPTKDSAEVTAGQTTIKGRYIKRSGSKPAQNH
jgi:hypothetical protein